MSFDEAYSQFILHHMKRRKGEAKRRLKDGHGHAEKMFLAQVWWPALGTFNQLHPEFEVQDFQDGFRYLDFAFIRESFRICFEIDGYGPHSRDINRRQFADNLLRQNHLILDDWKVIRFTYDDICERPRRCQQMIQQMMGLWFGDRVPQAALTSDQKEIIRLAKQKGGHITPREVSAHLGVCRRTAQKHLHELLTKQLLSSAGEGTIRIRSYRLLPTRLHV
jgi:very-short-patch-repair endonuclease